MKTIFKKGTTGITTLLALGGTLASAVIWINSQFVSTNDKIAVEKNSNISQQKDIDGIREDLAEIKEGIKEIKNALRITSAPINTYNQNNGFISK